MIHDSFGEKSTAILFLLCLFMAAVPATTKAQVAENILLVGSVDDHVEYSDIWGYTDEFGSEYAILGERTGTAIINVTDPATAYETGFITGPNSIWRDMKVRGDYAYVVTEGTGGGLQIIDLSDPENPVLASTYTGFSTAHNLYIEEATGRAYVALISPTAVCTSSTSMPIRPLPSSWPTGQRPTSMICTYATTSPTSPRSSSPASASSI